MQLLMGELLPSGSPSQLAAPQLVASKHRSSDSQTTTRHPRCYCRRLPTSPWRSTLKPSVSAVAVTTVPEDLEDFSNDGLTRSGTGCWLSMRACWRPRRMRGVSVVRDVGSRHVHIVFPLLLLCSVLALSPALLSIDITSRGLRAVTSGRVKHEKKGLRAAMRTRTPTRR